MPTTVTIKNAGFLAKAMKGINGRVERSLRDALDQTAREMLERPSGSVPTAFTSREPFAVGEVIQCHVNGHCSYVRVDTVKRTRVGYRTKVTQVEPPRALTAPQS